MVLDTGMGQQEEAILAFWKKSKIYEKSKKKNAKGKKFFMMDGPPYATGHIHLGTALNKVLKDVAMRTRRMQGYDVFDRPLYDTHGVPIELQVEKEIGSRGKQDIEKFGVQAFVARCKSYATQHIDTMNSEFQNLGVWMDWKKTYCTFDDAYIEAIWAAFKEADKKGLLYLGSYPVHVCTRCQTAVAYNEIEYVKQKDTSIYVKFSVTGKKKAYFIIFTTTPWTLPANTGIMVNPTAIYQEVKTSGETWIIAKELVPALMAKVKRAFTLGTEMKGTELAGMHYTSPLASSLALKTKKAYEVVLSAKYVNTSEGTGLVHCAPGHGKEDYEVGKEYGLDVICPVGIDGVLTSETGTYAGKVARIVDSEIIRDLEASESLVYQERYEHDYPVCWRDKTPLLMLARPQWFLKVSDIQKKLLKENEQNTWIPSWAQLRMKAWLTGISDWPISRQRYWGAPLPIWYDEKTGEKVVVGSMKELKKLSGLKKIDMHKPGIDAITLKGKSGKQLMRVPEVLDVWFDSGVSSWAILGYPGTEKQLKRYWPADLNIEGTDQFRGWWNSQMILSHILFGAKPFETIMVHGMILDLGKRKMSKSEGNITSPEDVIKTYSRDFLRYYLAKCSRGLDFAYDEKEFETVKKLVNVLQNTETFIAQTVKGKVEREVADTWILSKYHTLLRDVVTCYMRYDFSTALTLIEEFAIQDMSRTYIKLIRERAGEVVTILQEMLIGIYQLLSPVMPFMAELFWQRMRAQKIVSEESIMLSRFPSFITKHSNPDLEKEFALTASIIETGLAERDRVKIGLRWPLASATISTKMPIAKKMHSIIMNQLNVKHLLFTKSDTLGITFDTALTSTLEAEGFAREVARKLQSMRKEAGLNKDDVIRATISASSKVKKYLQTHKAFLQERANCAPLDLVVSPLANDANVFTVREEKISVAIRNS